MVFGKKGKDEERKEDENGDEMDFEDPNVEVIPFDELPPEVRDMLMKTIERIEKSLYKDIKKSNKEQDDEDKKKLIDRLYRIHALMKERAKTDPTATSIYMLTYLESVTAVRTLVASLKDVTVEILKDAADKFKTPVPDFSLDIISTLTEMMDATPHKGDPLLTWLVALQSLANALDIVTLNHLMYAIPMKDALLGLTKLVDKEKVDELPHVVNIDETVNEVVKAVRDSPQYKFR